MFQSNGSSQTQIVFLRMYFSTQIGGIEIREVQKIGNAGLAFPPNNLTFKNNTNSIQCVGIVQDHQYFQRGLDISFFLSTFDKIYPLCGFYIKK